MHHNHGWITTAAASAAATLWPAAAAIAITAMCEPPDGAARSSLILGDLWLLAGAMTATVCLTVLLAAERHRKTFFEYGYLTAMADAKTSAPISINTKGGQRTTTTATRRGA